MFFTANWYEMLSQKQWMLSFQDFLQGFVQLAILHPNLHCEFQKASCRFQVYMDSEGFMS
jgi:hypothetical protein